MARFYSGSDSATEPFDPDFGALGTLDWNTIVRLELDPMKIPPEGEMKAGIAANNGRVPLPGPNRIERIDLNPWE